MKNEIPGPDCGLSVSGPILTLTAVCSAILMAALLNTGVFGVAVVRDVSMRKTLTAGERLVVDKTAYSFREPDRGEIIVFLQGEGTGGFPGRFVRTLEDMSSLGKAVRENRYVKRVIGVSGDKISISGGDVYLNGEKLTEPYVEGDTPAFGADSVLTVPPGSIFVMGDNRGGSFDSRQFGFVDLDEIEGRVVMRILPFDKITCFKR